MTRKITISVTAPVECTDEQFREWSEFCLGHTSSMSSENPLSEYDLEASEVSHQP